MSRIFRPRDEFVKCQIHKTPKNPTGAVQPWWWQIHAVILRRQQDVTGAGPRQGESMTLPEFWQFLNPGWWILHVFATAIVYLGGISHGRKIAMREMERKKKAAAGGH
jgi:hypothetical protein